MNKSPEKFLDSSEKEGTENNRLSATIERYIECNKIHLKGISQGMQLLQLPSNREKDRTRYRGI